MRLSEALRINQAPAPPGARPKKLHLVCGFTPLHLETFVKARAKLRFPAAELTIGAGLFGDLEGNIKRASEERAAEGAVVILEWSDVDERLGLRASAGWSAATLADIEQQAAEKLPRLEAALSELAKVTPVALVAPTLPLPPLSHLPPFQAGAFDLELRSLMSGFLGRVSRCKGVRVVSDAALALHSPHTERRDVKLELLAGFPYTLPHASHVAQLSLACLFPAPPKKGLITDLDDTLWKGILGEAGIPGVSWSIESQAQSHSLYQQALASLSESGVLIAIVSKNDPELVRQALERPDILLNPKSVFPIEASWGAKSEAVGRVLQTWNVAADSIVFVDDSLMELAEVADRYPGIECLRFPTDDPAAVLDLLFLLRERFGKQELREEDRIRLPSLRSQAERQKHGPATGAPEDFLARLDAKLTLNYSTCGDDGRALELVNKTNQFNLNGQRYSLAEWHSYFEQPGAFLVTAAYEDRFGPLGKIAVLAGRRHTQSEYVQVDMWVMSCRAFSRQIEFQVLRSLYQKYGAATLAFSFAQTERNGPLQEFFSRFIPSGMPEGNFDLTASAFHKACPQLFHEVVETS
ncbi:MAG TPA: HAD-IIIC family phosphatase [Bryobacteraceae bacterium]|jgi:FkbH-like protein|nr:HAD-IIIC family phosphatase [Bryobacteraceae bacterium]